LCHRLFAIEYYNPRRKARHKGCFFKKPDAKDLARVTAAEKMSAACEWAPGLPWQGNKD
jgi:hypothetical protein